MSEARLFAEVYGGCEVEAIDEIDNKPVRGIVSGYKGNALFVSDPKADPCHGRGLMTPTVAKWNYGWFCKVDGARVLTPYHRDDLCLAHDFRLLNCTRRKGHVGDHVSAGGVPDRAMPDFHHRWPSTPSPKPVTVTPPPIAEIRGSFCVTHEKWTDLGVQCPKCATKPKPLDTLAIADRAVRFLANLNLQDFPANVQRERADLVSAFSKATGKGGRDS